MNTTHNNRRLADLAEEIGRLDAALIEQERDALEVMGSEVDCETTLATVTATRIALDRALRSYFIQAEVVRKGLHQHRSAA